MSSVNIGGSSKDRSFRYKMPRLVAKVEGRGNGIKTRIVNIADIAKALKVPPSYPIKYFGFELGAQARWTEKTQAGIVNGAFTAADLQAQLDGFVRTFVLCPGCGLPEIDLSVKKGNVLATCMACGAKNPIGVGHKLTGFIVKNPPPKKQKASSGAAKAAAAVNGEDPFAGDVIDVTKDVEDAANDEDVEWFTDTSEAAVLERQKKIGANKLLAEMGAATIQRDIVETVEEFRTWYQEGERTMDEVLGFMADLKATYVHSDGEIVGAFCDVVWDKDVLGSLPDQVPVFEEYVHESSEQKVVLGNVERVCGEKFRDDLLPYTGHILKALYELDVVDDEVMLKWGKKKSSKYVLNAVSVEVKDAGRKFLDWLEEAEESYDSYDESDDGSDDGSGGQPAERFARGAAASAAAADDDDDDDLDIDDI